jgi:hypothetical protein
VDVSCAEAAVHPIEIMATTSRQAKTMHLFCISTPLATNSGFYRIGVENRPYHNFAAFVRQTGEREGANLCHGDSSTVNGRVISTITLLYLRERRRRKNSISSLVALPEVLARERMTRATIPSPRITPRIIISIFCLRAEPVRLRLRGPAIKASPP